MRLNAISGWSDSSRKFLVLSGVRMELPRSAGLGSSLKSEEE